MNEIYWITRLNSLNAIFCISSSILGLALVGSAIIYFSTVNDSYMKKENEAMKKCIKFSFPSLIISILLLVFTPTTKEAIMIWGVGGTIDYIKSNETAKQLPDKCIMALGKFVDEYMLNTKDGDKKEE